jgi:hypothetical protein
MIVSERLEAHILDIASAQNSDLDFEVPFSLKASSESEFCGFVLSFDVLFGHAMFTEQVTLSTGVQHEPTHWKQTACWLHRENRCKLAVGNVIEGKIQYQRQSDNPRDYAIIIHWKLSTDDTMKSQKFLLVS